MASGGLIKRDYAHGRSQETRQLEDVIRAWPCLPPEARASIATLARTLAARAAVALPWVGEPSPTAGASPMHRTPAARSPVLAGGGGSLVPGAEPVEGTRRHGNAVTDAGFAASGTRLPAESGPGAGGDAARSVQGADPRAAGPARGEARGQAAASGGAEGGDP